MLDDYTNFSLLTIHENAAQLPHGVTRVNKLLYTDISANVLYKRQNEGGGREKEGKRKRDKEKRRERETLSR